MLRAIGIVLASMALWLLLSGIYKPLLVGFGIASSFLVLIILNRMARIDGWKLFVHLRPLAVISYTFWLIKEIAVSAITVSKIVLSKNRQINQKLFSVRTTQKTDLGQFIFANSITLTPGTVSIEVEPGHFVVHAISFDESDRKALADMDARVSRLEAV